MAPRDKVIYFYPSKMKDTAEELKILRNSENKPVPTIKDLEAIAEKVANPDYNKPIRPHSVISRLLPECYTTFTFNNINIKSLHEETLFFIFYAIAESELQIKAYNELIHKGYLYSKMLDGFVFFDGPKSADNKKKSVLFFDQFEWEKCTKEVVFDEKFVNTLESFVPE